MLWLLFSSPGQSQGRAGVLPSASALALVLASAAVLALAFYVKVFYVMGKALSGELSCPCDRSCLELHVHSFDKILRLFLRKPELGSPMEYLDALTSPTPLPSTSLTKKKEK